MWSNSSLCVINMLMKYTKHITCLLVWLIVLYGRCLFIVDSLVTVDWLRVTSSPSVVERWLWDVRWEARRNQSKIFLIFSRCHYANRPVSWGRKCPEGKSAFKTRNSNNNNINALQWLHGYCGVFYFNDTTATPVGERRYCTQRFSVPHSRSHLLVSPLFSQTPPSHEFIQLLIMIKQKPVKERNKLYLIL